jgi:hypothetical protein
MGPAVKPKSELYSGQQLGPVPPVGRPVPFNGFPVPSNSAVTKPPPSIGGSSPAEQLGSVAGRTITGTAGTILTSVLVDIIATAVAPDPVVPAIVTVGKVQAEG